MIQTVYIHDSFLYFYKSDQGGNYFCLNTVNIYFEEIWL